MEILIKNKILEHIELSNNQRDEFMKGKSCLTNLLETLEEVTDSLDQGFGVDVIFLDYAKAVDKSCVPYPTKDMINKLQAYGCTSKVSRWVQDFQVVSVRNATSSKAEVLSGVPQDSGTWPTTIHSLHINDLPNHVNSSIQMFADDTKIFTNADKPEDASKLQHGIDGLQKWSINWLLRVVE